MFEYKISAGTIQARKFSSSIIQNDFLAVLARSLLISTRRPLFGDFRDSTHFSWFFLMVNKGGGWYLIKVREVTVKKNSMKYFCAFKENIAYMECVIQTSIFHSFYLFLSILLCNVDSALVSDSNAYIWISNCIQMFEFKR